MSCSDYGTVKTILYCSLLRCHQNGYAEVSAIYSSLDGLRVPSRVNAIQAIYNSSLLA